MSKEKIFKSVATHEDVETFCAYCENLVTTFNNFQYLFEKNSRKLGLQATHAERFFLDLQRLLIGEIISATYKITDKEETHLGKTVHENLSTNFFAKIIDLSNSPAEMKNLETVNERMNVFREKISDARNKKVSHLDRVVTVEDTNLGGFTMNDFQFFANDLQIFVDIVHNHYCGTPSNINHPSSANELMEALEKAQKYDELKSSEKAI